MSKLYRTVGVGANQQTADVTNEKIRYYKSESDLDTDLANISDDEVIFTQEGNDDRCGISLGMVVGIMSNVVPQGFLPCNGVAFDENQFPALYTLLGDNHTPDLRECNLVGAGQSTRTILDEAGHAHDVYTIGQFKDDQIQNITGNIQLSATKQGVGGALYGEDYYWATAGSGGNSTNVKFDASRVARAGATTHGKNFGINYVIKATSGLTIEQQDYVLQSLLEADSYSTEEVATGKKWIDGKMIYRKVLTATNKGTSDFTFDGSISDLDTMVSSTGYIKSTTGTYAGAQFCIPRANEEVKVTTSTGTVQLFGRTTSVNSDYAYLVVEYTKAD